MAENDAHPSSPSSTLYPIRSARPGPAGFDIESSRASAARRNGQINHSDITLGTDEVYRADAWLVGPAMMPCGRTNTSARAHVR